MNLANRRIETDPLSRVIRVEAAKSELRSRRVQLYNQQAIEQE